MNKLIINLMFLLSGGAAIIGTTGCANAALAVTDPRSISTVTSDQYNKRNLQMKYSDKAFESDHIFVEVYNHEVLLTGQVRNLMQRYKVARVASEEDGITFVHDYLHVSSTYTSTATEDSWITGKVKSSLFGTSDVNSNDVKIVTTDGVVYFLGIVDKSQLPNMMATTRGIEGVKKVVPLVHYKNSDSKLNLF